MGRGNEIIQAMGYGEDFGFYFKWEPWRVLSREMSIHRCLLVAMWGTNTACVLVGVGGWSGA